MSLVSTGFLVFLLVGVIVYYLIPKKAQWAWLLILSYAYYLCSGYKTVVFILLTTIVTFTSGILLERTEDNLDKSLKADGLAREDKKALKEKAKTYKKRVVVLALLLVFGVLAVVKYHNFAIENVNGIIKAFGGNGRISTFTLLLPLGISFYSFQSISYVIDVYRGKVKACNNIFKYALFVSYFPQITQGPIGRYDRLAPQFLAEHKYDLAVIQHGLQRMAWGLFKKFIIADRAGVVSDLVFNNPGQYHGIYVIIGVLAYCAQLYGDFAGGIDMVMGASEMFGIHLDDNFRQPFFSHSIGEFWRRWHITLGTWMKDYVFYPVTLSKWMGKFGKWGKKVFGKKTGRTLPICLANLIVFFVVGVWHGAAWKYIVYGMYNGIIIAFSGLMAEHYRNWKKKFNITGKENWYHVFMIIRTFILVNISWFFDRADTVGQAFHMMKLSVTKFAPSQLLLIPAGKEGTAFTPYALAILAAGCIILFIVSVLQERGMKIRESLAGLSLPITVAIYFCLLASIGFFGSTAVARGFIYAQF